MTPEERSLLEKTYKMVEENNEVLRGIRRNGRISLVMRGFYWVIIIGLSIGAYYVIQPYTTFLTSFGQSDLNAAQNAADEIRELLNSNSTR